MLVGVKIEVNIGLKHHYYYMNLLSYFNLLVCYIYSAPGSLLSQNKPNCLNTFDASIGVCRCAWFCMMLLLQ